MNVLNKKHGAVGTYIGRPTKWGNPFVIGRDGSREEVVEKYREWAENRFTGHDLVELIGKDLVCWCAPLACHGDVLVEMVEQAIADGRTY